MEPPLTPEEGRVLGCLVEKQLTTPQQYPLTLNALELACNQTTNREPVMTLSTGQVEEALEGLKSRRLVRYVLPSHGRSVVRYRQVLDEVYGLDPARLAVLAVLLVRGPQTAGELRARTARLAESPDGSGVEGDLEALAGHEEELVHLLPRRPGQKEDRWQQRLAEEREGGNGERTERRPPAADELVELVELVELRQEVASLRQEVHTLRASLEQLQHSLGDCPVCQADVRHLQ